MSKFSVKKPFTVLVAVIAAITLGFVSLSKLQLDLLPEISLPYLIVITTYPGASAEKVEEEVCKPMEDALGTINGVENIYSICNENYGMVELEFQDGTDLDSAMVKVSSALNTLESYLPEDCGTPSIMEIGTNLMASIYLAVSMDGMSAEDLFKRIQTENYDSTRVFYFNGAKQLIKHINTIKQTIRENSLDWNEFVILADSSTKKEQSSGDEKLYDRIATMEGIKELNANNICFNTSEIPYTSILSYKGLECKHVVLVINSRVNINTFELYVGMTRAIIDLQLLVLQ